MNYMMRCSKSDIVRCLMFIQMELSRLNGMCYCYSSSIEMFW